MDSECVLILPRVCELLAGSGSCLPDDTSLEKLMDWFTSLTEAGVSLLDSCPCLLEFISTVVCSTSPDASILSFTLKLAGLIAVSDGGFKLLQQSSVLDLVFDPRRWVDAGFWEDPCVRIGWIQGLRTMFQHSNALGFFLKADLLGTILQLQTDRSLFVASAAGRLLAQVLLSVSSSGHNDESLSDLENPSISMTAKQKRSAVVSEILGFLKKSLVPTENSQRGQQILKLLALLLAQTGAPLRGELLLTITDSLEDLVTEAPHGPLTLPLMEVILAAHSNHSGGENVPDERLDRLLSLMLDMRNPAESVQAAAAFIHSGNPDRTHSARSCAVLLLPLHVITGLPLLSKSPSDQDQFALTDTLKSKSLCVSVTCASLSSVPQLTVTAAGCLPCPPASIVSAVLALLKLCSGDSSSPCGSVEIFRNISGSGRVKKSALEALSALSRSSGVEATLAEVFGLLTEYLNSPDSDPSVLQKSYQALLSWIPVSTDLSSISEPQRHDLVQAVRKRACDVRWEVRDSTLEFLGLLWKEPGAPRVLLGGCRFVIPLLMEALQDSESYVRASAICALEQTLTGSRQQGAALTQEQTDITARLLEILSQDSEGFARRASVKYFIAWFSSCSSPSTHPLLVRSVSSVLSLGMADLDWEVKVHTLELAELLLDGALSGLAAGLEPCALSPQQAAQEVLSALVQQGVFAASLGGLFDCDRPVALKACRMLIKLRDAIRGWSPGATETNVTCELPRRAWTAEIKKITWTEETPGAEAAPPENDAVTFNACEALRTLDLDERLAILTRSSDHVYNSPLSLLQDILNASNAGALQNSQPGQEVIVDCY